MNTRKRKSTTTRATATPTNTATASAQPQPAPAPAASAPPPSPAPTAPAKRKLPGYVVVLDTNGRLRGTVKHVRAEYQPRGNAVLVRIALADDNSAAVFLDHVHTRAHVTMLRDELVNLARFHRGRHAATSADFPPRPQFSCYGSGQTYGDDEAVSCEFLPHRDLIQWTALFSFGDTFYTARIYLSRAEAQALLCDLERALADLERYEDTGL